jgi:hypothetical protein
MRKRSKYRPKPMLANPVAYVMEGFSPVTSYTNYLLDVRIKNHGAMTALTQGRATRADMDILVASLNIVEALYRRGFGADYKDVVHGGLEALRSVGARGAPTNKFILRADEMRALNEAMELHDAQLEIITVRDMEVAVKDVRNEFLQGRMIPIVNPKEKTHA